MCWSRRGGAGWGTDGPVLSTALGVRREYLIWKQFHSCRGADKSLSGPTSQCILFDGGNISFDTSLVISLSWRDNPLVDLGLHPHSRGFFFLYHTYRHTTVSRTPLDELSVPRRDLYLATHSTHNRQTSLPPVGFEPTISAGERP